MSFIFSFLVSLGVSILNNIQKKYFLLCGLSGSLTYIVYLIFSRITNAAVGSLIACLMLAFLSQLFSKLTEAPSAIFTIPGIMPIVPGSLLFKSFSFLIEHEYNRALSMGVQALLVGFAIAIGLIINEAITQASSNNLENKNIFRS